MWIQDHTKAHSFSGSLESSILGASCARGLERVGAAGARASAEGQRRIEVLNAA